MTTLTINRGISGSGKSTWARQQNAVVVSRDALREQYFPHDSVEAYYKSPVLRDMEDSVTAIQDATIAGLLKAGKDVIVDDTNISMSYVNRFAKIGYRYGADVVVKVFDVEFVDALQRVKMRANAGGRDVPVDAILKQWERFKSSKKHTLAPVQEVKPYNGTPGKPKAFLVDIDGTLAHMRDYRGPFEWAKVGLDDPDETIIQVVRSLFMDDDVNFKVIVMSGRDESCRAETAKWLDLAGIPWERLFMRPEGDMRPDNVIKAELFDTYVRDNFDVQFVLDDRQQVVDMWRRMGLTCLQVAPGDF